MKYTFTLLRRRWQAVATIATIAAAVVGVVLTTVGLKAGSDLAPALYPADRAEFARFAALGTDQEKVDFLAATRYLESAAECLSNVGVALERGEVVGVPLVYTASQITEIQNQGLVCAYRAKIGFLDAIAIAEVSVASLDTFAANNSDLIGVLPTYCTPHYTGPGDPVKCAP